MNDTLRYLKTDPYFRAGCHNDLTFSLMYAFSENFVLPLSHDEVVHLKGSLWNKAPGNSSQKFATVRAFWTYMLAHPGKKLLFMGAELGQPGEWNYETQLPWELLDRPENAALNGFFREANTFYDSAAPLWEVDFDSSGFQWLCADERERNVLGFVRRDENGDTLVYVCNFSGITAEKFRLGVTEAGTYEVVFSSDEARFGGSGTLPAGTHFKTEKAPWHDQLQSILVDIPPLSGIFLRNVAPIIPLTEIVTF